MKAFFAFLLAICASASLYAQVNWHVAHKPVGVGPSAIFADTTAKRIHVLTAGNDADFDGVFQPGTDDVSAGWYVLDADGNVLDSTLFNGYFNGYPVRAGFDTESEILYAPVNGKVGSYSLATLKPINEELIDEPFASASFDPISHLLLLSRTAADFTSRGSVVYFDPFTESVIVEVEAGVNPAGGFGLFRPDIGGLAFYSINEGVFGQQNSSVTYSAFASDIFATVNAGILGGGGSDMVIDGGRAFILLNGTHQVRILDVLTNEEVAPSPINVGTEGFDGPRSLAVSGDTLVVGTYTSDVRRFDLKTGEMIDAIPMPGKVESVALYGPLLFASIIYSAGTYDSDSLLVVVDMATKQPLDTMVVGGEPAAIFVNRALSQVTILGYGSGETPVSWWKTFDGLTSQKVAEGTIPFNLSFPLRGILDDIEGKLTVVGSDTLFRLDVTSSDNAPEPLYTDPTATGNLFSVSDGGDYWFVTERPTDFAPSPCYLHAIRKDDGKRIAKFRTGGSFVLTAAPVPSKVVDGTAAYILHEGNFGGSDATLAFAEFSPALFEGELGSGANQILHATDEYGSEITAIPMTGSHEVVFLDIPENGDPSISQRVPTGTTDLDGPRQCVLAPCIPIVFRDALFVTTNSGEVLFVANGDVLSRDAIGGKGEGITVLEDKAYTANAFETGTYTPGTTLSVISITYSSVDESDAVAGMTLEQNFPNPATERTTIPFTLERPGEVALSIYSTTGELVASLLDKTLEAGRHEVTINTHDLPNGTYLYLLKVGSETVVKRMEVVR